MLGQAHSWWRPSNNWEAKVECWWYEVLAKNAQASSFSHMSFIQRLFFDLFKVRKIIISFLNCSNSSKQPLIFWLGQSQQKCIVKTLVRVKCLVQNQKQILTWPLIQCQVLTLTLTKILVEYLWIWTFVFSLFCICNLLNKPADSFSFPIS